MVIKIDKEFKKLIPPIGYEEFLGLEESIKKEGCRDPIIIWNNVILDGHNRYRICKAHEIKFEAKEMYFVLCTFS
jgi:ParB-like chromosome segregation protein Spo0J